MANIGDYLKRFSLILKDKSEEKKIVQNILHRKGFYISYEEIEIKNTVLYIKASAIVRNEITIQKKELLQAINNQGIKITDFRW